jgi:hypothetical protein
MDGPSSRQEAAGPATTTATAPADAGDGSGADGGFTALDGTVAEDEFASDAINYQILLGKIDAMLERLKLDA